MASGAHVEHIIPEAIGCPPGFVLPGTVVCRKCNNNLGYLDRAISDEFDFLTFLAGVPRKRGRPPVIASRGNVVGTVEMNEPTITFNMEQTAKTAHDGSIVAPYRGQPRNVRGNLEHDSTVATISFELAVGKSPKFVRGLFKIGFSCLTYFLGASVARDPQFQPIRDFVLIGEGKRHALLTSTTDKAFRNSAWPPYERKAGEYAVCFRLACVEFLLDLTPSELLLPQFVKQAHEQYGEAGWCVLPPNS